jgi:F-type H+-transporting ATPase subunit b
VDVLAVVDVATRAGAGALAAAAEGGGLEINLFWVGVSSLNFVVFLLVLYRFGMGPIQRMLDERRLRVEQGLRDADAARQERDQAALDRLSTLTEARHEANDILQRAQKIADETRERELAAVQGELQRMREEAVSEIEREKQRALAEVRGEVADLALRAAGRVVGETMTGERERRLVEQFLAEVGSDRGVRG